MSVPLALLQKYILESGSLFRKFVTQDGTQTPAAATLNIFRQGATAVGAATVPAHAFEFLVTVNSSGRFAIGDLIAIGSTVTSTLVVDDIPNSTQLSLTNLGGQAVAIPAGVRLLPANDRPQFYSVDASGVPTSSTAIGSVVSTNSQTGIAAAALTETGLFDLLISGSNVAARFETDQGGPTWCVQPAVLNAAFYGSIQAAIDALPPEGGEVYVPQGTWIITAPIVIPERTTFGGVKLRGDGWWRTKIQSTNAATDMIQIQTSYTTLEGLHFVGPGAPGNGKGIVIFKGTPGADFAWIRIADCRVEDSPSWALDAGGTGSRNVTECSYERCSFVNGNRDGVVRVRTATTQAFTECQFGMKSSSPNNVVDGPLFTGTCETLSLLNCILQPASRSQSWVFLDNCVDVNIRGCYFEDGILIPGTPPYNWFIEVGSSISAEDSHAILIEGCIFRRNAGTQCNAIGFTKQVNTALVSHCEMFSATYSGSPHPGDNDLEGDVKVVSATSQVTVLGCWHACNSTFRAAKVVDNSRKAGSVFGYRVRLPQLNNTDRDNLVLDPKNGDLIFNSTTARIQVYIANVWHDVTS